MRRLGLASLAIVAVTVMVVVFLFTQRDDRSSSTSTSTSSGIPDSLVLAPATSPPAAGLCSQQLEFGADGNAGPVTCENGAVNVLAWRHLVGLHASVMTLGPSASPDQVHDAMCADLAAGNTTNPLEQSAERIAEAYYGWRFGIDVADEIDSCR